MKKIFSITFILSLIGILFLCLTISMAFYSISDDKQEGEVNDGFNVEGSDGFVSPMKSGYITSEFGYRWGSLHSGIDMSGSDKVIYASAPGEVGEVGYDSQRGNYVYINHMIKGSKYSTAYFHMSSKSSLRKGENVGTNTVVGQMGNTGDSQGAHLHFEILKNWYTETGYNKKNAENPRTYLTYPGVGVYWSSRDR